MDRVDRPWTCPVFSAPINTRKAWWWQVVYPVHSLARRLLEDDSRALEQVIRWITTALTSPRYWSLRGQWPDLVQEVLARLIESLRAGRYDAGRDFQFYVHGIVRHAAIQALDEARRRRADGNPEELADGADDRTPSANERASIRQLVRRVMDEASEECRHLLRAHYLDEKAYVEIAQELSLPVGTVKSRLSRCLESARRSFRVAVRRRSQDAIPIATVERSPGVESSQPVGPRGGMKGKRAP